MDDVLRAYGLTEDNLLGRGWESQIYALGQDRILKIPHPDPGAEAVVRAQQAFALGLPPLPFAVPCVREITRVGDTLITIEDRIPGRSLAEILPGLTGERRRVALAAYLEVAEAMAGVRAAGDYGDLLVSKPVRCPHWGEYLAARLKGFADDPVLAGDIPDLDAIVGRLTARLLALPDPEKRVVHGDIWPPNVMMDDELRVTGLIDFSFTTRVGDTLMDLAGAVHFQAIANPHGPEDSRFLMDRIEARHGTGLCDRIALYATWFAFSFAYNHDMTEVYDWCLDLIRKFGREPAP